MIFLNIFYFVVFAVCLGAATATFVSRKVGGFKDVVRFMTVCLACFCGALVSVVYFFAERTLSGSYILHLSYAMTPLFLHRVFSDGWLRLLTPLLVSASVAVASILSFCDTVTWCVDVWIPPLMVTLLIVLIVSNIWRLTKGRDKFDAVAAGKGWTMSLADTLYYSALILLACVGSAVGQAESWGVVIVTLLCVLLLFCLLAAVWLRLRDARAFLLFRSREKAFIGNINRCTRPVYVNNEEFGLFGENLFIRLKEYFDEKLPYLDPDLTLTDVSKSLITNKVYLSRAISDFTGKNFCQFVNMYRVKYAIRLYNCNSAYKIPDLAVKSGFHSERSFTMAFRLYMNVTPSRWLKMNKRNSVVKVLRN